MGSGEWGVGSAGAHEKVGGPSAISTQVSEMSEISQMIVLPVILILVTFKEGEQ